MTPIRLSKREVRKQVNCVVKEAKESFTNDSDRNEVIEWLDDQCDSMWADMVQYGLLADYNLDDLRRTLGACTAILQVAEEDAWIESDSGLWEGVTYGVVPIIAFYSLRNCLYAALERAGYDTNNDYPFAEKKKK